MFVVAKDDVVAGHMLLNEVTLKNKGLLFGRGQDEIEADGLFHQPGGLGGGFRWLLQIGEDPFPKILGLANIE